MPARPSGWSRSGSAGRWTTFPPPRTERVQVLRPEPQRGPPVRDEERSPPASTNTPIRPVGDPATRTARTVTPSAAKAATRALPATSRPTAHTERARARFPQPPCRRGSRAALAQGHAPGDVRATGEVPIRQHDIHHQVADHHDARPMSRRQAGGRGAAGGGRLEAGWAGMAQRRRPRYDGPRGSTRRAVRAATGTRRSIPRAPRARRQQ